MKKLSVKVKDDIVLDAGTIKDNGEEHLVLPPEKSLFKQLTSWLLQQAAPSTGPDDWVLGIGVTALCLRWGTYLSVLMDETKPIDERAKDETISMISDQEIKRINIEASSNLSHFLKMMHDDEHLATNLALRAYEALPMPQKRVKPDDEVYRTIIVSMMAANSLSKYSVDFSSGGLAPSFPDSSASTVAHPFRSLANMIINMAYRNGPIEDTHAGVNYAYRFTHRRFTARQAQTVIRFTSERLSGVMGGIYPFWDDNIPEVDTWPERLSGLPLMAVGYPSDWSMTDEDSRIRINKQSAQ